MAETALFSLWAALFVLLFSAICHFGALFISRRSAAPVLVGANGLSETPEESDPPRRGLVWLGKRVSVVGLILLTAALASRTLATGHGPFTNQHEFAMSFAWGIMAAYVYFEWRHKVTALAYIAVPLAVAMTGYALTVDSTIKPLVPALQNRSLLTLHISAAVISYGAFAVAFSAACLYLLHPKMKVGSLPSQDRLDELGYRATVLAFPMLTIMIILGAIWADIAWGQYWSWDPKETAALVTWLVYGGYLHARVVRHWRGSRAAWLLVIGFAAVLFTFFGNLFFGGLHAYA